MNKEDFLKRFKPRFMIGDIIIDKNYLSKIDSDKMWEPAEFVKYIESRKLIIKQIEAWCSTNSTFSLHEDNAVSTHFQKDVIVVYNYIVIQPSTGYIFELSESSSCDFVVLDLNLLEHQKQRVCWRKYFDSLDDD